MKDSLKRAAMVTGAVLIGLCLVFCNAQPAPAETPAEKATENAAEMKKMLDFPLLFTKRRNIQGIHIYDTYYKWFPGGGIYVLENPSDAPEKHRVRTVIDPKSKETLGEGMYWQPELSFDAKRVLFCHKGESGGSTSIYEIGIDGMGLRRVTNPSDCEREYHGAGGGVHDFGPSYLPDGRIVFTSNRYSSLIPCANEGSDILHVMNADGSNIRAISVNCETEFDPTVMEDGRILFGRWEYIDKTALTVQSLWSVHPDGTKETAVYANNMVFPEAILDPRQVPGDGNLVVCSFTPHNSPPRGAVAMIDMSMDKNDPAAIYNFDTPDKPTNNRGNSCDPYPLSPNVILYSGMNNGKNAIMMVNRSGDREVIFADPAIDCHAPIPVRPRKLPRIRADTTDRSKTTGKFYVQDIYEGMPEVDRGAIKYLRVLEDTSRTSKTPGGSPVNQTFLVSAALSFTVKDYMGIVPVEPDGSVYFEVPSGRAVFFQALDAEGRCVRSMRTFIQAAPGTTRSCIGCHENKRATYLPRKTPPTASLSPARQLQDESWGSGPIVYVEQIQPIFDRHCVACHGGEKGMGAGLDLTGGWTELFNISYEHLSNRREVQYIAPMIGGIDCMNGTSYYSSKILPSYSHGSGKSLLTDILVDKARGHEKRFDLSRTERDLILAWMDSNGQYNGTWDYVSSGFYAAGWKETKGKLQAVMGKAGCMECHTAGNFESDWFNLQSPELSRILRAPLAKGAQGYGLGLCRARKASTDFDRLRMMTSGRYEHAVKPLESFPSQKWREWDESGEPVVSLKSNEDDTYKEMLDIIRQGRGTTLASPRGDMPGANIIAGQWRKIVPRPMPKKLPPLAAGIDEEGLVTLSWPRDTRTWGLAFEVHRGESADFTPSADTLLSETELFRWCDKSANPGKANYALVLISQDDRSAPIRASINVPPPVPPKPPAALTATSLPGRVELRWQQSDAMPARYYVYRAEAGTGRFDRLTAEPTPMLQFCDAKPADGVKYAYTVRAVSRRGSESTATPEVLAAALPEIKEPLFVATFAQDADAQLYAGGTAKGTPHGKARLADGVIDLSAGGHVAFDHRGEFDLAQRLSVECQVYFAADGQSPVVVGCGHWQQAGWFLQKLGGVWRWHVGGIDCDGGKPVIGRWFRMVGTFDGQTVRLYENGRLVAEKPGSALLTPFAGPLIVGQYSGGPGPQFQVTGQIKGVKIYNRVLSAEEVQ
ncbi:MAG: hypothetical protein HQ567_32400 [Candidatus Nealsonbacteria bacterium]|nr:hypothetical protein [Candidatus Nealsonbacteria bacterium]